MNPQEYINLAKVERAHWYYSGKRELVRRHIHKNFALSASTRLLDCGAGTGIFAEEMAAYCDVRVLDDHEESLRLLRQKFEASRVICVTENGIPVGNGSQDILTAMDVLEHIEKDDAAVKEFERILRPGGLVVVTVPASMALWSDWDVALHHFRRYDRDGLRRLFLASGNWDILTLNYTNTLVFPVVWFMRKMRWLKRGGRGEDYLPPKWINCILRWLFVRQGLWSMPMPWGVSLVLVARLKTK